MPNPAPHRVCQGPASLFFDALCRSLSSSGQDSSLRSPSPVQMALTQDRTGLERFSPRVPVIALGGNRILFQVGIIFGPSETPPRTTITQESLPSGAIALPYQRMPLPHQAARPEVTLPSPGLTPLTQSPAHLHRRQLARSRSRC